jgi:hypothetical protein
VLAHAGTKTLVEILRLILASIFTVEAFLFPDVVTTGKKLDDRIRIHFGRSIQIPDRMKNDKRLKVIESKSTVRVLEPKKRQDVLITLTVHVPQEVIDTAVPNDSRRCFVSDSVQLAYPHFTHIETLSNGIYFTIPDDGMRYQCILPTVADVALRKFDGGSRPEPFTFKTTGFAYKKSGWTANHPNSTRAGKVYQKTDRRIPKTRKFREFGANIFKKQEEAGLSA